VTDSTPAVVPEAKVEPQVHVVYYDHTSDSLMRCGFNAKDEAAAFIAMIMHVPLTKIVVLSGNVIEVGSRDSVSVVKFK